jgi:hypothetical protein
MLRPRGKRGWQSLEQGGEASGHAGIVPVAQSGSRRHNVRMTNKSHRTSRWNAGCRIAAGLFLGLAVLAAGRFLPGGGDVRLAAQALNPCALLTIEEIQPLAAKASVANGVASSVDALGSARCRFTWGTGVDRYNLDVVLNDASRMFAGSGPDAIRQGLQASVRAGTADAVISGVGEAAVFRADSPLLASASTYVKGRILQVRLDGFDAREKKDDVVALLMTAAARL